MSKVAFSDRLISIICYITFGFFGIIWLVFANVSKINITKYLSFNIYQSIFLSIALAVLSLLYSIAINLLSVIPFVGNLVYKFDLFFNQTPLYFSFTVSGLFVTILLLYLSFLCLVGLKPYLPLISEMINGNFGG